MFICSHFIHSRNLATLSIYVIRSVCVLKPFLSYVHIKDALSETKEIVPAGKGDGHLAQILSAMDTDGYRGFLSLEPHLADFSGFRGLEQDAAAKAEHNTEKTFRIAYDALLQLLS